MAYFKSLANKTGKACFDFEMLKENDKILVCYSGGKDSYLLIKILKYLQKKYPINFKLKILIINPNFDNTFENNIIQSLNKLEKEEGNSNKLNYEIVKTQIKETIDTQNKIKKFRPCFMCSRLRRGIIYDFAIKNGYNKIALGHNLDDAIETHLMNLFYSNKTSFMKPKYLADNKKITIIRPMIYLDEDDILAYTKKINFKAIKNECPLRDTSESNREYFKDLIRQLKERNPKIKESAYHAFSNIKELNPWNTQTQGKQK